MGISPHSGPFPRMAETGSRVPASLGRTLLRTTLRLLVVWLVFQGMGRSAPSGLTLRNQTLTQEVSGYTFNLLSWEVQALREKALAVLRPPLRGIPPYRRPSLVVNYLETAQTMADLERQNAGILAENRGQVTAESRALQAEIERLRALQQERRGAVEAIIQRQVGDELVAAGFSLFGVPAPPVQFAFVEAPKKLVVSRRERIETVYGHMLAAEIPVAAMEEAEEAILREQGLSAYVTGTGGLGAYPAIVVDRYGLEWTLSTVAHEWVHNYLTFFPLGFNYGASPAVTTINETVADIVGDEIGLRVLRRHYPEHAPPPEEPRMTEPAPAPSPSQPVPLSFDFGAEMRVTRLRVDRYLAAGQIAEAEAYMERQRQMFVRRGYGLRVLNQAYFAFHGSYATGPFSVDPLGPKLQALYRSVPDLYTFLATVRPLTSGQELETLLAEMGIHGEDP